ncbi:uncharacterized protein [Aegilops tauschii subsp. strangulata]|uniref:uncharacterized protein n=1 Tax=Aegilops tauschii subsp. strangulata TaxID=200361 RepID=UPI003CC87A93
MSIVPYAGGLGSSLPPPVPVLTGENYPAWADQGASKLGRGRAMGGRGAGGGRGGDRDRQEGQATRAYLICVLAEDLLLQVASKKTAAEIWACLKMRFAGADRVRAARLASLRSDFELLRMDGGETLDGFAGKLSSMAARYAGLGSTLEDPAMVKKLLDSVPDRLYAAFAGMEQFCDVSTMPFEEALRRLKAFEERLRRRGQGGGERADGQLMFTAAQWRARERQHCGARDDDDGRSVASGNGGNRRGRCYKCGERGHFKRECPLLCEEPAAECAPLADASVEDDGLLSAMA